jgi:ATP-dependent Clp protease ATP-binding subunit ClpB
MDKGALTLGNSTVVDMSKSIIVMTSNLGSAGITKLLAGTQLGFVNSKDHAYEDLDQNIYNSSMNAIRKRFSPEFVGRIDRTIVFRPLDETSLRRIVDVELDEIQDRLFISGKASLLTVSELARDYFLREGVNDREGARNLKKVINREIVAKASSLIATGQLLPGDELLVDFVESELIFHIKQGAFEVPPPKKYLAEPVKFDADGNVLPFKIDPNA